MNSIYGLPVYRFGDLRSSDGYDFSIGLTRDYALEILNVSINDETREVFENIGCDILKNYKYSNRNPYSFFEDTLLVGDFILGREGRWLNVSRSNIESLSGSRDDYLEFHSHNIDSSHDRDVLMTLFTTWINYIPTVIEISKK